MQKTRNNTATRTDRVTVRLGAIKNHSEDPDRRVCGSVATETSTDLVLIRESNLPIEIPERCDPDYLYGRVIRIPESTLIKVCDDRYADITDRIAAETRDPRDITGCALMHSVFAVPDSEIARVYAGIETGQVREIAEWIDRKINAIDNGETPNPGIPAAEIDPDGGVA